MTLELSEVLRFSLISPGSKRFSIESKKRSSNVSQRQRFLSILRILTSVLPKSLKNNRSQSFTTSVRLYGPGGEEDSKPWRKQSQRWWWSSLSRKKYMKGLRFQPFLLDIPSRIKSGRHSPDKSSWKNMVWILKKSSSLYSREAERVNSKITCLYWLKPLIW